MASRRTRGRPAKAAGGRSRPVTGARAACVNGVAMIATAALSTVARGMGVAVRAQPSASASVTVTITVAADRRGRISLGHSISSSACPTGIRCHVPRGYRWDTHRDYRSPWDNDCWFRHDGWWWPAIVPVRIPFTVSGNALASVSVAPSAFLRIRDNRYLGRAVGRHGGPLGYDIVVHFPAPARDYRWLADWMDWDDWDDWSHWRGFGSLPRLVDTTRCCPAATARGRRR